jgi:hypothetical protein
MEYLIRRDKIKKGQPVELKDSQKEMIKRAKERMKNG